MPRIYPEGDSEKKENFTLKKKLGDVCEFLRILMFTLSIPLLSRKISKSESEQIVDDDVDRDNSQV